MLTLGGPQLALSSPYQNPMKVIIEKYTVEQADPLNWTVSVPKVAKDGGPSKNSRILAYHPTLNHALQWLFDKPHGELDVEITTVEEFSDACLGVLRVIRSALAVAVAPEAP